MQPCPSGVQTVAVLLDDAPACAGRARVEAEDDHPARARSPVLPVAGASAALPSPLSASALEDVLGDVEVGEDILHVVAVFQRVDDLHGLARVVLLELDGVLGHHA